MPDITIRGYGEQIDAIYRQASAAQGIHIQTRIDVYDRGKDGGPVKVDERSDISLLLDPGTGIRCLRSEVEDTDRYDRMARSAQQIVSPISAHPKQLGPLLDDSSKVVWVLGGSRAGKSDVLAARAKRSILQRGGPAAMFWWLAPSWSQARIGSAKMFKEQTTRPAVIPREYVISWPAKPKTGTNTASFIDGSTLEMHHANDDGDNLRGWNVDAVFCDEFTAIHRIENFRISLNRTLDTGGQWFGASTPKQGHWAYDEILRADGTDSSSYSFMCHDNPWMPLKEIERLIKEMGGPDDPVVRREVFGEWISDGVLAYEDFRAELHTRTGDGYHCEKWGMRDITGQVAPPKFSGGVRWDYVGGQDFNVSPMSTVIAQVCIAPGSDPGNPDNWHLFVLDEVQTIGRLEAHCDNLAKRKYAGISVAVDPTGARDGTHGSQAQYRPGATTNMHIMRSRGFNAKSCAYKNGKPANVDQLDSLQLMNRLFREGRIIVHRRCKSLINGMQMIESQADGRQKKPPNSAADKASSCPDALRYLVWRIFAEHVVFKIPKGPLYH